MAQTAAEMKAARVSPRLSKRCVAAPPPHWNCSQAAKNREKPAHPMSTVKKRRVRALLPTPPGAPPPPGKSPGYPQIFPPPPRPPPPPPPPRGGAGGGRGLTPGF